MLVSSATAIPPRRCPVCTTPGSVCAAHATGSDVIGLDPLNPTEEVDHMPDLKYYNVTRAGQKVSTRMKLNAADVKVQKGLGATVEEVSAPGTKRAAAPANKSRAGAVADKGAAAADKA